MLDTAVLQWAAGGGSPELGAAVGPAEMRSASIELARRVDAIRDFVADGVGIVGVQSVRVPLADRAAPRMPPAAQTGPEPAPERPRADPMCPPELAPSPRMPNDPWTEGRAEQVAARHQATIDKAFASSAVQHPWATIRDHLRDMSKRLSDAAEEIDALRRARQ